MIKLGRWGRPPEAPPPPPPTPLTPMRRRLVVVLAFARRGRPGGDHRGWTTPADRTSVGEGRCAVEERVDGRRDDVERAERRVLRSRRGAARYAVGAWLAVVEDPHIRLRRRRPELEDEARGERGPPAVEDAEGGGRGSDDRVVGGVHREDGRASRQLEKPIEDFAQQRLHAELRRAAAAVGAVVLLGVRRVGRAEHLETGHARLGVDSRAHGLGVALAVVGIHRVGDRRQPAVPR
mmetsp:Transcript_26728/g.107035  ORF Transcript_26728/g.107035 Transcript_26728/m.107035 type:complete len:236 (-) Transcript_26728:843-1550(-)